MLEKREGKKKEIKIREKVLAKFKGKWGGED